MNEKIVSTVQEYLPFVIKLGLGLFALYWFFYFTTPSTEMSVEDQAKIDSLINKVERIRDEQIKIDNEIMGHEKDVSIIADSILKLKNSKKTIQNIYNEELNRISSYSDKQVYSFFSARYGYTPR